jgi:hypothetical protein
MKEAIPVWSEYRRIKRRLLILLLGWFPFVILVGMGLGRILGTFVPSYVLTAAYMVFLAFTYLQWGLYACPNCGTSYRGRQMYRRTCPQCGLAINVAPPLTSPTGLAAGALAAPVLSPAERQAQADARVALNKRVALMALAVLIPFVAVVGLWALENPERARTLVHGLWG